jgi:hypothetical protein
LGFMSSLPQLAWDKRLWCCCIEYSSVALHVKSNNNKNRPFGDIRKKNNKNQLWTKPDLHMRQKCLISSSWYANEWRANL